MEGEASGTRKGKKKLLIFICKASLLVFLCSATLSIILYLVGNRPPEDEQEAYIWYLEHTENGGSPKNLNALGECYFFGRGTEVNFDQAFSCFEKAAPKNSSAQYNLAVCYYYGYGTEINDEKAFEYFQKAEDDVADAKAYAGHYYYCGWGGIEVDKDKANSLFELSKSKGSTMALYFQAMYYIFEDESEDRFDKAIELCQQVIDAGGAKGYGLLGLCYADENSLVYDYGKAYDYFIAGEEEGDDFALYGLGRCYEEGEIVKKDEGKAVEYYQKASALGNPYAN